MAECKHCRGTGVIPNKITLECIGCQRKVVVTYDEKKRLGCTVRERFVRRVQAGGGEPWIMWK